MALNGKRQPRRRRSTEHAVAVATSGRRQAARVVKQIDDPTAWAEPHAGESGGQLGRVGIVDIGSNTVRLVVYDLPTRLPIPVFNEKAQCALGLGLGQSGRLNPDGVQRALRSLKRFARLAAAMGVERLELVATAAVRDATDGREFVEQAEATCGHPIHVLSGAEEARLAAVGMMNGVRDADGVLGDLGGGSLDLVSLSQGSVAAFATLPLGHLRLAEISTGDRSRANACLDEKLATVAWLRQMAGRSVYCVGGSWRALARIMIEQLHHPLHVVDNYTATFFDALRLSELIADLPAETLQTVPGIDTLRVQTLPFAAAALAAFVRATRPARVVFSAYGMREGQMLELLPTALRRQDPLIAACTSHAERTGRFPEHGREILTWMDPLFRGESEDEGRLRLAACLLSDMGWSEHPDYRALHAFHRVLRVPYPGLFHSDRAELALATLIRYGGAENDRMVAPIQTLLDAKRLNRARVVGLALRLAHTISGGAAGLLPQTRLRLARQAITLELPNDGTFWSEAVDRRFDRLARAIGLKGTIQVS